MRYGGAEACEEERTCPATALSCLPSHEVDGKAGPRERPRIEPSAESVTDLPLPIFMRRRWTVTHQVRPSTAVYRLHGCAETIGPTRKHEYVVGWMRRRSDDLGFV